MCDYSLHLVASRPAKVGDKLVSTDFKKAITRGFSAVGEPEVAVCLLPGTEVAFDDKVRYYVPGIRFGLPRSVGYKTAIFRQINKDNPHVHHDALEFPDGRTVLVARLSPGQRATVLQLPAKAQPEKRRSASEIGYAAVEEALAEFSPTMIHGTASRRALRDENEGEDA